MTTTPTKTAIGRRWPESWAERRVEYDRRGDAYKGLAYDDGEAKRLGLFAYRDENDVVIHGAQRVMRDQAFIQDVDAAALATGLTLNLDPEWSDGMGDAERQKWLDMGLAVWERSRVKGNAHRWSRMLCVFGDLHMEPMLDDDTGEAVIGVHPARHVEVYYDRFDIGLAHAAVEFTYVLPPEGDEQAKDVTYRREMSADMLRWREDGGKWTDVEHGLGRVPLVHVSYQQLDDPSFGMNAGYGFEAVQAFSDSALSQFSVIGTRCADPLLAAIGFQPTQIDPSKNQGITVPTGGDLKWLEPTLTALQALVNMQDQYRRAAVETIPEFVFAEAGANASGTAIYYRAAQLEMKLRPIADRFNEGIAIATRIACALEMGTTYEEAPRFEVTSNPAVPMDKGAILELVIAMRSEGLILDADSVRMLQTVGLLPEDADPEDYAKRAKDQSGDDLAGAVDRAVRVAEQRAAELEQQATATAGPEVAQHVEGEVAA